MTDDKIKNDNEKANNDEKQYQTEWSFSFDKIGETISRALSGVSDEETRHAEFVEPIGAATSAVARFAGAVGITEVKALESGDNLIEADAKYVGELKFDVADDEDQKTVHMHAARPKDLLEPVRQTLGVLGRRDELYWHIGLSKQIPMMVRFDGIVGPSDVNLSGLQLTGLEVNGNVGPSNIQLPDTANAYNVRLRGGVGQTTLTTSSTNGVAIKIDSGVGQTNVNIPVAAAMTLEIDGGVGSMALHIAPNVAVRVEAKSGVGSINVPKSYKRVSESEEFMGKSGVWETDGFALSSEQVVIRYKGGVGSFRITQEEIQIV